MGTRKAGRYQFALAIRNACGREFSPLLRQDRSMVCTTSTLIAEIFERLRDVTVRSIKKAVVGIQEKVFPASVGNTSISSPSCPPRSLGESLACLDESPHRPRISPGFDRLTHRSPARFRMSRSTGFAPTVNRGMRLAMKLCCIRER